MSDVFICAQCREIFTLDKNRCCPKCHSFNIKIYDVPHSQEESKKGKIKDTKKRQFSRSFLVCIVLILASFIGYSEVYRNIIEKGGKTQNASQMIYERDKKAFQAAKKIGSLSGFQEFLAKYPTSVWGDYAIYFRDKAAYDEARNSKSLEAIVHFLQTYPDSSWVPNARYYLKDTFGYDRVPDLKNKRRVAKAERQIVVKKDHLSKSKENDVVQPDSSTETSSADIFLKNKEYDRAIMAYQKIIISPTSSSEAVAYSLFHQALSFLGTGDNDTAKVMFKKLTRKFPSSEYSEKALRVLENQQIEIENRRSTPVTQKPETKSTLFRFAETSSADNLFKNKEYEMAIMYYQKIITSPTSSSEAVAYSLFHQALSFQGMGDNSTAKVMFKKITRKFPSSEYSDKAQRVLGEI